jgi:hypothetical protein
MDRQDMNRRSGYCEARGHTDSPRKVGQHPGVENRELIRRMVATCGDDVTDAGVLAATDIVTVRRADLPTASPDSLDVAVDQVDVLVGGAITAARSPAVRHLRAGSLSRRKVFPQTPDRTKREPYVNPRSELSVRRVKRPGNGPKRPTCRRRVSSSKIATFVNWDTPGPGI